MENDNLTIKEDSQVSHNNEDVNTSSEVITDTSSEVEVLHTTNIKKPFDRLAHLAKAREKARLVNIARKGKGTPKQKSAIAMYLENGGSQGEAMRAVGYSEKTALNPSKVFGQDYFQSLLNEIPDRVLIGKMMEIASDDDKRSALQAVDMLMKLKDRYPANKLKVQQYGEELGSLVE